LITHCSISTVRSSISFCFCFATKEDHGLRNDAGAIAEGYEGFQSNMNEQLAAALQSGNASERAAAYFSRGAAQPATQREPPAGAAEAAPTSLSFNLFSGSSASGLAPTSSTPLSQAAAAAGVAGNANQQASAAATAAAAFANAAAWPPSSKGGGRGKGGKGGRGNNTSSGGELPTVISSGGKGGRGKGKKGKTAVDQDAQEKAAIVKAAEALEKVRSQFPDSVMWRGMVRKRTIDGVTKTLSNHSTTLLPFRSSESVQIQAEINHACEFLEKSVDVFSRRRAEPDVFVQAIPTDDLHIFLGLSQTEMTQMILSLATKYLKDMLGQDSIPS
jgi:hypothetical protein